MHLVKEGIEEFKLDKYNKVNLLLTEILCANGTCPVL
jgi:hypothetical protein